MAELVSLGIPIQCNLHYKDANGNSAEYKFYMQGEKVRAETQLDMTSVGAGIVNVVTVMRGDNFVYSSIPNPAKCDWVKFDSTQPGSTGSSFTKPEELDNSPGTTYECTLAAFGDEKFATPGKICTMQEAYQINAPTN